VPAPARRAVLPARSLRDAARPSRVETSRSAAAAYDARVSAQTPAFGAIGGLPGIEAHPHARAVLTAALRSSSGPSHAYLFHGPHGAGKRAVARAFAAALLAEGAPDADEVVARVARGSHPDLTWVTPSGAAEMLVADV